MLSDKTVLLVQSPETDINPIKSTLKGCCKEIYTTHDSTNALEIFKGKKPDIKSLCRIIISDYQMPGMDGRQFYREIRKLDSQKIFIMISRSNEKEVHFDEPNVTLYKPFSYDLIIKTLNKEVIKQLQL